MAGTIIDGKAVAAKLNIETARAVAELAQKGKKTTLAVVLVGDDPASQVYVRNKIRTCGEVGIISREVRMSADSTTEEVLAAVKALNEDPDVDGILVQSPPPPQVDEEKVIEAIDPDKDVDCFAERNVGRLLIGQKAGFRPCTPWVRNYHIFLSLDTNQVLRYSFLIHSYELITCHNFLLFDCRPLILRRQALQDQQQQLFFHLDFVSYRMLLYPLASL